MPRVILCGSKYTRSSRHPLHGRQVGDSGVENFEARHRLALEKRQVVKRRTAVRGLKLTRLRPWPADPRKEQSVPSRSYPAGRAAKRRRAHPARRRDSSRAGAFVRHVNLCCQAHLFGAHAAIDQFQFQNCKVRASLSSPRAQQPVGHSGRRPVRWRRSSPHRLFFYLLHTGEFVTWSLLGHEASHRRGQVQSLDGSFSLSDGCLQLRSPG